MDDRDRQPKRDRAALACAVLLTPLATLLMILAIVAGLTGWWSVVPLAGAGLLVLGIIAVLVLWTARP